MNCTFTTEMIRLECRTRISLLGHVIEVVGDLEWTSWEVLLTELRSGSLSSLCLFPNGVDALHIKLPGILYSPQRNHTFIICCTHFSAVHLFLIKDAFGRMAAKMAPNPLLPTEWGPSRHIVPFCPLEHYPRGHFRTFCPLEGVAERQFSPMFCPLDRHLKKNTFNMFNSTRRAAEGELCVCLLLEAAPKWALHQSEGNS